MLVARTACPTRRGCRHIIIEVFLGAIRGLNLRASTSKLGGGEVDSLLSGWGRLR